MGRLLNLVTPLHQATKREYLSRMLDDKVFCMKKAKYYVSDYWDGSRRFGYGGYRYIPGRWKQVAEQLITTYSLNDSSKVLDVGCGKGYLLYELKLLLPRLTIAGFDISGYAIKNAKIEIGAYLSQRDMRDRFPYSDGQFDLVLSIGCLHNLRLFELEGSIGEIQRVSKAGYVMVESYRNEKEMFNLECWALTAESILDTEEWLWIFKRFGYQGDYEFIYFQ